MSDTPKLEEAAEGGLSTTGLFPVRDFAATGTTMHVFGATAITRNDRAICNPEIRRASGDRRIRKPKFCPVCFPGNSKLSQPNCE